MIDEIPQKTDAIASVNITEANSVEENQQIDLFNIDAIIPTTSVIPTKVPKKLVEQIIIYKSGATSRLYLYDTVGNAWKYIALT